jgi:PAS domain S-box-containing protein
MRIGVTRDKPVLRDILNKAVATLTPQEVNEIVNRHVSISVTSRIDYSLLFKTVTGFLVVVGIGLAWMTVLRRKNRALAALGEQLRRDMEARIEIEAALRRSEERYRLLVETAQEGIVVAQDGYLAYANPAVSIITGYSTVELETWPFSHYVFPEDRDLLLENHRLRLEGKEVVHRYQLRILRKNGEVAWVEMSGIPIEWGGRPASLNFLVDISER